MSYPLAVLGNMPNVMKLLQIPEDHYISLMVGFGYPEIRYARGVQREANGKIKRIVFNVYPRFCQFGCIRTKFDSNR